MDSPLTRPGLYNRYKHLQLLFQKLHVCWFDRISNDIVSSCTGLTSIPDMIPCHCTALFGHVAQLAPIAMNAIPNGLETTPWKIATLVDPRIQQILLCNSAQMKHCVLKIGAMELCCLGDMMISDLDFHFQQKC